MRRLFLVLALLLGLSLPAVAQQGNTLTINFPGVPSGGCVFFQLAQNSATGDLYWCKLGTWALVAASGAPPGFPLLAPNGTAAAPSYSFTSRPATGMYLDVNSVALSVGGLEVFNINGGAATIFANGGVNIPLVETSNGGFTGTFALPTLSGSRTYTFPDATGNVALGTGTSPNVAKFTGANALGNSTVTDDGTNPTREPNGSNSATAGNYQEFTVDTSGVTVGLLACATSNVDGAGRPKIQTCATNNVAGLVGVAQATVAAGGTALVCWTLNCPAKFDGQTTALDVAIVSTSVAGELQDTGGQTSVAGTQNFTILNANSGAGTSSLVDASGLLANNPPSNPGGKTKTIASGTAALGTGAIASAACAAAVSVSGSGIKTTDTVVASFNSDPTAVTGYIPSTSGMLTIMIYPTANHANFRVCNNTSSSVTPGAITLNWRVDR